MPAHAPLIAAIIGLGMLERVVHRASPRSHELAGGRGLLQRGHVHSRAERAPGAGDDDRPDRGVGRRFIEAREVLVLHRDAPRVLPVGVVQRDGRDAVGDVVVHEISVGHERGTSFHGTALSTRTSPGRPRSCSPMMLRWISSVPPSIELARERTTCIDGDGSATVPSSLCSAS